MADTTGHGHDGYYFLENGEVKLYEAMREIAKIFVELGLIKATHLEPTSYTEEEIAKNFGPVLVRSFRHSFVWVSFIHNH